MGLRPCDKRVLCVRLVLNWLGGLGTGIGWYGRENLRPALDHLFVDGPRLHRARDQNAVPAYNLRTHFYLGSDSEPHIYDRRHTDTTADLYTMS